MSHDTTVPQHRALVTGGASGIGHASAKRLAEDGVEVITTDIAPGADIRLDVTDAAAVDRPCRGRRHRHPPQQRRDHRARQAALGDHARRVGALQVQP